MLGLRRGLASPRSSEGQPIRRAPRPITEWAADEELRIIALSSDLADYLGIDVGEMAGQPLTRVVRLEEDEAGEMPLINALAVRRNFTGQRARSRADESRTHGTERRSGEQHRRQFRGLSRNRRNDAGNAEPCGRAAAQLGVRRRARRGAALAADRIIESAERIVERADGPLRGEYAGYGGDIAAAARHLLSVIRSMTEDPARGHRRSTSRRWPRRRWCCSNPRPTTAMSRSRSVAGSRCRRAERSVRSSRFWST